MAIRTVNSCCGNDGALVEHFIGTAYDVVKTVYDNLGTLQYIYDFLNQHGVLVTVDSVNELKALKTEMKYARVYTFSTTAGYGYTDYLYVEGDTSGVIPNDTTATGSWIVVASSTGGGGTDGGTSASYIPWVYAQGSALGGETTIAVPNGTVGVPFIIVEGYMNTVGYGFTYDTSTLTVTLAQPLEVGDEVVLLLTGTPAVPDNPNISNWVTINWLYNGGYAVGAEQVIAIPYTFEAIPAIFKNGLRYYAGLAEQSYTVDAANQRILLTEPLSTNDRLIVQIGGESTTVIMSDRTIQEIARSANVRDNEVILSSNTTQYLNGMKVIYDEIAQKMYALPTLPSNVYINTVSNGELTYSPGNITVDLLPIPNEAAEGLVDALIANLAASDGYKYIGKCATIAELRTTEPATANQTILVQKYYSDSLISQGQYYYDATDTTSIDNGGSVIVTTGGKRWKFSGQATVETYGAYADGVKDDAAAFRRCIDAEDLILFLRKQYLILSPLEPKRSGQVFQGGGPTKLIGQLVAPATSFDIFSYTLSYREGVQFRDFNLVSANPGVGKGFYSPSSLYVANPIFQNVGFQCSLQFGIDANLILATIKECRFGLEGTLGASYMHIRSTGQAPVGSALTTNANIVENCRFFKSNSAYGIDFVNGLQIIFRNCDFETNTNTAGIIRVAGMLTAHFDKCWWERNDGAQLVKVQMDSTGTTQGCPVISFDKCWIKLDGTGNTCVLLSDTPNFNVSFTHCAGTQFAGKNLFMINATANPLQYLKCFLDNYFVGFTLLPQNTAWMYELGVNLLEFRDTVAGTLLASVTANTTRVVLSHNTGVLIQKQNGTIIAEIVSTATGTQIRALSQDGTTLWKLQPPTSGSTATAAQWTVV